ncbi:MAG: hypothetical protein D3919_02115 [Candidatus Electrothrix sp. AW5]|nr:hypothetical protein [Candidatus Electrothrix gigas]
MLDKRGRIPSYLKLFDYFVKYFFQTKKRKDTEFSLGRGKQKASLEGKKEYRARENKSLARRKGRVSGEGK